MKRITIALLAIGLLTASCTKEVCHTYASHKAKPMTKPNPGSFRYF